MNAVCRSTLTYALATCSLLPAAAAFAQTTTEPISDTQILQSLAPRMRDVILLYDAIRGTPIVNLTPQDARQQLSAQDAEKILARGTGREEQPMPVGKVTDGLAIPGEGDTQIPIRIYTPAGNGPFPVTVYFHGGGFVVATINTYDASARALCDYSNSIVVSVEYRKAPEGPFPAARRDAITSYKWVLANIGNYNGNAAKVAVAGESAGGNLATEVSLAARNQGLQMPTHELLIYPITSSDLTQQSDLLFTSSVLPLNTAGLKYFSSLYVPDASELNSPEVAPINAKLRGLPPTTIIAAEFDPLRSDGVAYAAKLRLAQVPVAYQLYPGTTHEFFGMGGFVNEAKQAEQFAGQQLAASFK